MDRQQLYKLLNEKVLVQTVAKNQPATEGYLVCVDPQTLTLVLYDDTRQTFTMILSHAVKTISKCESPESQSLPGSFNFTEVCSTFFGISTTSPGEQYTAGELSQRRQTVLNWMATNAVPVEELDDALIAAYSVIINAPYTTADCQSTNALLLSKVQKILGELPTTTTTN